MARKPLPGLDPTAFAKVREHYHDAQRALIAIIDACSPHQSLIGKRMVRLVTKRLDSAANSLEAVLTSLELQHEKANSKPS